MRAHLRHAMDLRILCAMLGPQCARMRCCAKSALRRPSMPTAGCQDVRWAAPCPVASMRTRARLARTAAQPQPNRRRPHPSWSGSKTFPARQRARYLRSKPSRCSSRPCLRDIEPRYHRHTRASLTPHQPLASRRSYSRKVPKHAPHSHKCTHASDAHTEVPHTTADSHKMHACERSTYRGG